jgi:hypothetical protein
MCKETKNNPQLNKVTKNNKSPTMAKHKVKFHLANIQGKIRPYLKVSNNLKAQMQVVVESYAMEKGNIKEVQDEIRRSGEIHGRDSGSQHPSFEASSTYLAKDPFRFIPPSYKDAKPKPKRKKIDSFFYPIPPWLLMHHR